jgi:hypothetical protein
MKLHVQKAQFPPTRDEYHANKKLPSIIEKIPPTTMRSKKKGMIPSATTDKKPSAQILYRGLAE